MKTLLKLIIPSATVLVLFIYANSFETPTADFIKTASIDYPENVKAIIDNKCYNCHNNDAKNKDAKDALNWDDLSNLEKKDQVAALDGIIDVLEEGIMPPKKAVAKYPDLKLTEEEKETLMKWAEKKADELMK